MYEKYEDSFFINIPKEVLNSLSSKARKELETAVKNYHPQGYTEYAVEHMGRPYGQHMALSSHLVTLKAHNEKTVQTIIRTMLREEDAISRAQSLASKEKELSDLKNSIRTIKSVIE